MKDRALIVMNWALLACSVIGWPVTALTVAKDEPQVVLGLSWMAITLTALTALIGSYVKRDTSDDDDGGGG